MCRRVALCAFHFVPTLNSLCVLRAAKHVREVLTPLLESEVRMTLEAFLYTQGHLVQRSMPLQIAPDHIVTPEACPPDPRAVGAFRI